MELTIIIVNYRTPDLTIQCLDSVSDTVKNISYEVIVVDNHSNDQSEEKITKKHPHIKWINNRTNEGFGRANNIAIQQAKGENILLINSDLVLNLNTVDSCIQIIKSNNKVGAVGCLLLNEDGSLQKSKFSVASFRQIYRENLLFEKIFKPKPPEENALMGSFLMFPAEVLKKTGIFDPDFFMYCEELELCNRIQLNGFDIVLNDKVSAIHKHGGSSNSLWADTQKMLSNSLLFLKVRGLTGYFYYHILSGFNFWSNFIFMWFLDSSYRKGYWHNFRCYYRNIFHYFGIPFLYSTKTGTGKRLLIKRMPG